jgi:hypothetical protein
MKERSTSLRKGALAATLTVTVGIWALAMWAWLGPGSSKAPVSAPTAVGTRIPAVSGLTDRDSHAPPTPQPAATRTATTADREAQALPAFQSPPVSSKTADKDFPALPAPQSSPSGGTAAENRAQAFGRTTLPLPDTATAVVRGIQASLPSEIGSDGNTAIVRGKQAPSSPSTPPDSGSAVVRGTRATSGSSAP